MNRAQALETLQRSRAALQARGIAHAAIFGSVARNQVRRGSDIDILVTPAEGTRLDLFDLGGVQAILEQAFGIDVDVVVDPVKNPRLRRVIERDRADAF